MDCYFLGNIVVFNRIFYMVLPQKEAALILAMYAAITRPDYMRLISNEFERFERLAYISCRGWSICSPPSSALPGRHESNARRHP